MSENSDDFFNNSDRNTKSNYRNQRPGWINNQNNYLDDNDYNRNNTIYAPMSRTASPPSQRYSNTRFSQQQSRGSSRVSLDQRNNSPIRNLQNQRYSNAKIIPPPLPRFNERNNEHPPALLKKDLTDFRQRAVSPSRIVLPPVINVETINCAIKMNKDINTFTLNVNSLGHKKFELIFDFIKEDDIIFMVSNQFNSGVQISQFQELEQNIGSNIDYKIIFENDESSVIFSYINRVFFIKLFLTKYNIESTYEITIKSEEQKLRIQEDLIKIFNEFQII